MNPADEVDIEVVTSKAREEYERRIAKVPRADRFSVTFNGNTNGNTNGTANATFRSSPVSVTDEAVFWQARLKLERIQSYTTQIRNNLRAVEVLDELWDNGTEVAVIPKATLDVLDRLLRVIETASQQ